MRLSDHRKILRGVLAILEPKHQSLYRRKVARSQSDAHNQAVANVNANQRNKAVLVRTAILNEKRRAGQTRRETNRGNQRRFVNVLFDNVAQKRRAHSQKENREAKRPFHRALGKANVTGNFLAENRPTINSAN